MRETSLDSSLRAFFGQIVIEHGTFSKRFITDVGKRLARKGIQYLVRSTSCCYCLGESIANAMLSRLISQDAPVSGGPERARLGTLSIMVGGDEAVYRQALPLLESMGSSVVHMGGTGDNWDGFRTAT